MNLSVKWLRDFLDMDLSIKEFAHGMTLSGSKVEGYEEEGTEVQGVVVGKITAIEAHPDADKLRTCKVDIGNGSIQVVTGAANVFEGAVVPVALEGASLPGGIKIKKGKLRGVESCGMLCSIAELGVTKNDFPDAVEDGIFILNDSLPLGQDIRTALGLDDVTVEFEITSNRPDCLSVIGLAREASATFNIPMKDRAPQVKGSGGEVNKELSVTVQNTEICKRYMAKKIKNVKIGPSPDWMRARLRASGVRPINNMVDITNYVMLEYGQPMHAFDSRYIGGNKIVVRNAKKGETITTLDGQVHTLSPEMLMIADEKNPIAVAGVMGGEYSGIMMDTVEVIFESACFDGPSVRLAAKKLGLRTESSARFEKGLDPNNALPALLRACELVELLGAGDVTDGMIDIYPVKQKPLVLPLCADEINRFLGTDIPKERMKEILYRLSFTVDEQDQVMVPTFRGDVQEMADVAEEIARIYGYNNIPSAPIQGLAQGGYNKRQRYVREVADTLLSCGCNEIMTYSFISPKYYDKIGLPQDSQLRDSVAITNPLGEDTSVMRTTAFPSMLEILSGNFNNRNEDAFFYEIATEYLPQGMEQLPKEKEIIIIGGYGKTLDFYSLKGIIETLLVELGLSVEYKVQAENTLFHPGRCADIVLNGQRVGILGEIHPFVRENYDLSVPAFLASLDMEWLYTNLPQEKKYRPLPKFPALTRDLTLICDDEMEAGELEKVIRGNGGKILESVSFVDVYKGAQIETGKKSVTYSVTMRSLAGTLTDEEADRAVAKILRGLAEIGAVLRSV